MAEFTIRYTFGGVGVASVTAKNEEEAKDKFYEGNAFYQDDNDGNIEIDSIEKKTKNK